jgi:hypothetical protein
MLSTLAPFVGDVRGDAEQIALRIIDSDVVAIAEQPQEHFLREIVDLCGRHR